MLSWDVAKSILSAHSDSSATSVDFDLTEHHPHPQNKVIHSLSLPLYLQMSHPGA